ncbi:MAG TPA: chemotaxis-specific protein-glutamate methyltransferase CheB [Candidatus Binatia bacterium]|jgi:two-component system chemotaxis response regulator CheB|nr:chemotaxis-specific protein-glutamate methyltransferase CheB [Candidatus Binatia bacterium]
MNSPLTRQNPKSPIRVLLVDDSVLALAVLQKMLATSPEIQVVGTAQNGRAALELIPQLHPTVVCTDYEMPIMDGLELTRQIMARFPTPVLVISAVVKAKGTPVAFKLLEAGALDIFPKPAAVGDADYSRSAEELAHKIRILAGVTVFSRRALDSRPAASANFSQSPRAPASLKRISMVAIGASTGGPQAVKEVLHNLPTNFPVPILCVQHISTGFLQGLVDWLAAYSLLRVKIAEPGELASPGVVYFPPDRTHLEVDSNGRLCLPGKEPVGGHCPSVNVLFKSVAEHVGRNALGVLLTGMGDDGAEGLLAIAKAGGDTVAQNKASCVVFGMPKVAIDLGAAKYVLSVEAIAEKIVNLCAESRTSA